MCNNFNKKILDEASKGYIKDDADRRHEKIHFMDEAIKAAIDGMNANEGGPFGCVVVKDGKIVGRGKIKLLQLMIPQLMQKF